MKTRVLVLLLVGWVMLGAEARGQVPSLTLIEPVAGSRNTLANALSADGRTLVGVSDASGPYGFTWTAAGGRNDFGLASGVPPFTEARGVSADGSTVVGTRIGNQQAWNAFRYSGGVYQTLGRPPVGHDQTEANGVSGDGSMIVGRAYPTGGFVRPMRWTEGTGMRAVALPDPRQLGGWFEDVSRDGSTAIGVSGPSVDGIFSAYTWREAGGWTRLPPPASIPGTDEVRPSGVNFDGSLVVGWADAEGLRGRQSAILWRDSVPSVLDGFGSNWSMFANKVNDDASVIVGSAFISGGDDYAVIWLNGRPAQLQTYLPSLGVEIPDGYRIAGCTGVSADGLTISGIAYGPFGNRSAFIATIPAPGVTGVLFITLSLSIVRRRSR